MTRFTFLAGKKKMNPQERVINIKMLEKIFYTVDT